MTLISWHRLRPGRVRLAALLLVTSPGLVACHDYSPTEPLVPVITWDKCGSGDICGSGNAVQEERAVSGVTGVIQSAVGTLHIEQGGGEALRIEAEDNLLPHLRTEVHGGILHIWIADGVDLRPTLPIRFFLTVETLGSVEVTGVGDVYAPQLRTERLRLAVVGVADMELPSLEAGELEVSVAGAGDIRVSGVVLEQKITISGTGDYDAKDLQSTRAEVRIVGSGSATVRASEHLVVFISGTGWVYYYGNPALESTVTGSGQLVQLGV